MKVPTYQAQAPTKPEAPTKKTNNTSEDSNQQAAPTNQANDPEPIGGGPFVVSEPGTNPILFLPATSNGHIRKLFKIVISGNPKQTLVHFYYTH